jgi:hypothetical protein
MAERWFVLLKQVQAADFGDVQSWKLR